MRLGVRLGCDTQGQSATAGAQAPARRAPDETAAAPTAEQAARRAAQSSAQRPAVSVTTKPRCDIQATRPARRRRYLENTAAPITTHGEI